MGTGIFATESAGPFLYWEVAVWDKDNPSVGDDDDMLGIYSGYLFWWQVPRFNDGSGYITVGKRVGNVSIWLEIKINY